MVITIRELPLAKKNRHRYDWLGHQKVVLKRRCHDARLIERSRGFPKKLVIAPRKTLLPNASSDTLITSHFILFLISLAIFILPSYYCSLCLFNCLRSCSAFSFSFFSSVIATEQQLDESRILPASGPQAHIGPPISSLEWQLAVARVSKHQFKQPRT